MLARLSYELSLIESLISLWIYFFYRDNTLPCFVITPKFLKSSVFPAFIDMFSIEMLLGSDKSDLLYFYGKRLFFRVFFFFFSFVSLKRIFGSRCIKIYVIQVKWGQSFFLHISGDLVMEFTENPEMSLYPANFGSVFCLVYKTVLSFSISN